MKRRRKCPYFLSVHNTISYFTAKVVQCQAKMQKRKWLLSSAVCYSIITVFQKERENGKRYEDNNKREKLRTGVEASP